MKTICTKVILLGNLAVGKSTLIQNYVDNAATTETNTTNSPSQQQGSSRTLSPTVGAAYFTYRVHFGGGGGGDSSDTSAGDSVSVKCEVWDTGGQERFRAIMPLYYRNANVAVLVYDVTDVASYEGVQRWVYELRRDVAQPMALVLVGNKIDLKEARVILRNDAVQYSNSIGALYYECSAIENEGVEQLFKGIALRVLRSSKDNRLSGLQMDGQDEEGLLYATSTLLPSTDTVSEEQTVITRSALAHGTSPQRSCCY